MQLPIGRRAATPSLLSQGSIITAATGYFPKEIVAIGMKGDLITLVDFDPNNDGLSLTKDLLFYTKISAAPMIKLFNTL